MTPVLFTVIVALVGLERLAELVVSNRNLAWARERGGQEYGAGHYPAMVLLHTGFLAAMLAEVWIMRPPAPAWWGVALAGAVSAQALRWWCIRTLGHRWNTRVVVVPGLPLVDSGPYRWFAHPNYVAVVLEGVALPLIHGAWWTAVGFTLLNAVLLRTRLRVENAALQPAPSSPGARPAARGQ